TQAPHNRRQLLDDVINLFLRCPSAEAEANGGVRQVITRAKRLQYIGRLETRGGTGRARRDRDVVDAHQQRFAFDVRKADVQAVRQPVLHRTVDVELVEVLVQPGAEPLA